MNTPIVWVLTGDDALFAHWKRLQGEGVIRRLRALEDLERPVLNGAVVVCDTDLDDLPGWQDERWQGWGRRFRVVAASTMPSDEEGLSALNAGLSGYCHALAGDETLRQVIEVVAGGELWVGRTLLLRMLKAVGRQWPTPAAAEAWSESLTGREQEVARCAAQGDSNLAIAERLGITERTVKAHLTAVFEKLQVSDRLQLALRVHGLR